MQKTILIVDDSPSLRLVLSDLLINAGFLVLEAAVAQQALQLLDGRKIHLIICDLYMPGDDGLSLVQQLRELPAYKFTPVIMLSTETADDFKDKAYLLGAKAWVSKPFSPQQMLNAVAKLITV